jgi:hypothetical protein
VAWANSQAEAARRQIGEYLSLLRHDQGMARIGGYYGRAEFYILGPVRNRRKGGDAVQPGAARSHPSGLNAQSLGLFYGYSDLFDPASNYV